MNAATSYIIVYQQCYVNVLYGIKSWLFSWCILYLLKGLWRAFSML